MTALGVGDNEVPLALSSTMRFALSFDQSYKSQLATPDWVRSYLGPEVSEQRM